MFNPWKRFKKSKEPKVSPVLERRFSEVFEKNIWRDDESFSGPGSRRGSISVNVALEALEKEVAEHRIHSISGIPCGDINWMPDIMPRRRGLRYFDIVQSIVNVNRERHPDLDFRVLDVTSEPPPRSGLIFCKDLVSHLTYADVLRLLANMKKSKSQYLLLSSNSGHHNEELHGGSWTSSHRRCRFLRRFGGTIIVGFGA
ncbi:hypothetical protein [Ensifer adhaerens]|uniref:hypothetical protein n=1 Tax=Ensifer adhaerens TaxID=106592 RepID=UPI000DDD54A1|nr:hypothetical protein [Ensifer adhaerens]MBW0365445.1 hypothetical protein [Ensifer adhaerens]UCM22779.1 hypothetical protein LDL63_23745 [Ensifer adhaerens]